MIITIGELVSDIAPYAGRTEISLVNGIPFIRANITNGNMITKTYLYIIQVDKNTYTVCNDPNDSNGSMYFPLGSISEPFRNEAELRQSWLCQPKKRLNGANCLKNISRIEFNNYLHELLLGNGIISTTVKNMDTPMTLLGFANPHIKTSIEDEFNHYGMNGNSTIRDLIRLVNIDSHPFRLDSLKNKEYQYVFIKLRDLGLSVTSTGGVIERLVFQKIIK